MRPKKGIFHPMSSVAIKPDVLRGYVKRIIRHAMDAHSVKMAEARAIAARHLRVSPGTLENIGKGRLVDPKASIRDRICAAVVPAIQQEIARCIHELDQARQAGLDPRSPEMAALASAVEKAKEMIGETRP